jgi:hypothetical protein
LARELGEYPVRIEPATEVAAPAAAAATGIGATAATGAAAPGASGEAVPTKAGGTGDEAAAVSPAAVTGADSGLALVEFGPPGTAAAAAAAAVAAAVGTGDVRACMAWGVAAVADAAGSPLLFTIRGRLAAGAGAAAAADAAATSAEDPECQSVSVGWQNSALCCGFFL